MSELEKFGKIIANDLRDSALSCYLNIESGKLKSPNAKALHAELEKCSFTELQKTIIRKIVTQSIDNGVHDFLFALEEERSGLIATIEGRNLAELSDGLQGEIFTEEGWYAKFSQFGQLGI